MRLRWWLFAVAVLMVAIFAFAQVATAQPCPTNACTQVSAPACATRPLGVVVRFLASGCTCRANNLNARPLTPVRTVLRARPARRLVAGTLSTVRRGLGRLYRRPAFHRCE